MEGTYAQQANTGMTNFLGSMPRPQMSNSTPSVAPKSSGITDRYPNLKKLGALTTGFGESTRYEKFHPGIDIANKIGTPIDAFSGGTVVKVDTGKQQGDKGFGNRIIVRDDQGDEWSYGHLNDVYVKPGQKITKGQNISTMGNSGSTYSTSGGTGSHLDLRIYNTYKKRYVNPSQLIS